MDTINIIDGLSLTIVSLLTVFGVLAAIWGLVELTANIVHSSEKELDTSKSQRVTSRSQPTFIQENTNAKHQQVAELMALVLASEDEPNKKFEIIESKRVK